MLILLSETRKKLLWLWLVFTVITMTLILIQTIAGKYEDIVGTAFTWAFIQLFPCLILLYVALLLNKNASKLVMQSVFRSVYMGALIYLFSLFVFIVVIALPFATFYAPIETYLKMSYSLFIPFQVLLLILFSILYFKKEPLFIPNAAIVQEYTTKRAQAAQSKGNLKQEQAFELLLHEPDLSKVLIFLKDNLKDDINDIVVLQSQYTVWQREKDLNLSSPNTLQRQLNNLTLSVSNYIEKL